MLKKLEQKVKRKRTASLSQEDDFYRKKITASFEDASATFENEFFYPQNRNNSPFEGSGHSM